MTIFAKIAAGYLKSRVCTAKHTAKYGTAVRIAKAAATPKQRSVICGEYIDADGDSIHANCCEDCAEETFSILTGLEFLASQGQEAEEEFFGCIYALRFNRIGGNQIRKDILNLLRREFIRAVNSENDWKDNGTWLINELKEWCFASFDEWVEFVADTHGEPTAHKEPVAEVV